MALYDSSFIQRDVLVDLMPYNVATMAPEALRVGSDYFRTLPTDTPPNVMYYGLLEGGLVYERSMYSGGNIGGRSIPSRGVIKLGIPDSPTWSRLNLLPYLDKDQYTWDGQAFNVYLKENGADFSTRQQLFAGVADDVDFERYSLSLSIRDSLHLLDKPLARYYYLGTGGDEGDDSIKGRAKPECLGRCFNVSPVLINYSQLRYQVHNGPIFNVSAVRDGGVPLLTTATASSGTGTTLVMPTVVTSGYNSASAPVATNGYYIGAELRIISGTGAGQARTVTGYTGASRTLTVATWATNPDGTSVFELDEFKKVNASGWFDLLAQPGGQITADVQGSMLYGTYSARPGSLLRYIVQFYAGLPEAKTTPGTFDALDLAAPYDMGYYTGLDEPNCLDLQDAIVNSFTGFYGFGRADLYDCGRFLDPSAGVSAITLTPDNWEEGSAQRAKFSTVLNSVRVGYKKNWTQQGDSEMADSVPANIKALYSQEHSFTDPREDPAATARYALSVPRDFAGLIYFEADGEAVRDDVFLLFSTRRDIYTIPAKAQGLQLDVNDVITLEDTRLNLQGGKLGRILSMMEDPIKAETQLAVFV